MKHQPTLSKPELSNSMCLYYTSDFIALQTPLLPIVSLYCNPLYSTASVNCVSYRYWVLKAWTRCFLSTTELSSALGVFMKLVGLYRVERLLCSV